MVDIDKSKVDRYRYFACLSMLIMELDMLSSEKIVSGKEIKKKLDRFKVDVYADKKRCRVGLLLPKELNSNEVVRAFHKAILGGYREHKKKQQHYHTILQELK